MKISLNWLADYVQLPEDSELARRLTMAGLEVEQIERPGQALAGVLVGKIVASERHPNADKLSVTRVDVGGQEPLQIVCGATNYKVGDLVPVATPGVRLPNGVEISKSKLRGVDSAGMLCSSKELGLTEASSGLLILPADAQIGAPVAAAVGLDDRVFELNVTPNRPDALSHLGVAREVAALTKTPLRLPDRTMAETRGAASDVVRVRIDDAQRCPRYTARVIEGVKIGPSPDWIVNRLRSCGVRAINNVVDVTNYVLLEYGQPLHAFDLDLVAGPEIIVRLPRGGEKLTTLDGKVRDLHPEDLVICDRDRPVALAGVMGGATSEVSDKTTRVLLESAYFHPTGIRRSSKRHALHTEASHRFERGVDPSAVPLALDRAAKLIAELGGGAVLRGMVDVHPAPVPVREVTLRFAHVGDLLGIEVPAAEVEDILGRLGFEKCSAAEGSATFRVPPARVDVSDAVDLIEEVARVRGYEAIPLAPHRAVVQAPAEPVSTEVERRVRGALSAAGFSEVLNYSFVSPAELEQLGAPAEWVMTNPLSAEQSALRTTLLAGLLQNVSRNARHQVDGARFYEVGRVFFSRKGGHALDAPAADERPRVAGALYGSRFGQSWALPSGAADFYDAKRAVEAILEVLGLSDRARFVPLSDLQQRVFHPRETAVVSLGDRQLGHVGRVHPLLQERLAVPEPVYAFELDVTALMEAVQLVPTFQPIPRFPAVLRDLALVVDESVTAHSVAEAVRDAGGELVESVNLFDVYAGKPLPEGKKNLAFSVRYRAPDRTLTDADVNSVHDRIVGEVGRRVGGSLRGADAPA